MGRFVNFTVYKRFRVKEIRYSCSHLIVGNALSETIQKNIVRRI